MGYFELAGYDVVCDGCILRERRTDVMYAYSYRNGGITVMLAPDGKPLTYSAWNKLKSEE